MNRVIKRGLSLGLLAAFYIACSGAGDNGDKGDGEDEVTVSEICAYVTFIPDNPVGTTGGVSAFEIDPATGVLTEIRGSPFKKMTWPRSIAVDPKGKFAYVTDGYYSKFISAYRINAKTGALAEIASSPFASGNNPDHVVVDPLGRFVYVANVEAYPDVNHISGYAIDAATGALAEIAGSPFIAGTQIGSVVVDPSGKFLYVTNTAGSSSVSGYAIDVVTGALTEVSGSPWAGLYGFSMAIDPTGKFIYIARFGEFDIRAFSIDSATGGLSEIAGSPFPTGAFPGCVIVDPSGKFAYAACGAPAGLSDTGIHGYAIDAATGALAEIAGSPYPAAAQADNLSLAFDPTGKFLYLVVGYMNARGISGYSIDVATGALTKIAGSPFLAGQGTTSITTTRIR